MADVLGILFAALAGLVLFWLLGLKAFLYLYWGAERPLPGVHGAPDPGG